MATAAQGGAMGILERAGFVDRGDILCPHESARGSCAIRIQGRHRAMIVCPECKDAHQLLIRHWHARQIGPKEVVTAMLELGYTRVDAAQFVLQLAGDSLKVKLGFLNEADL
jgi:hypothetical protein